MQRWIPVLAVVLALQLALTAALGLRGDRLSAQKPDTPLVQAELKGAGGLLIEGPSTADAGTDQDAEHGASVALKREAGAWILPGYYGAPAQAAKVQGVLDKLADVKRGYAVATTQGALKRFKVAEDAFERRVVVSRGDETLATVYLGSSPGLRKTHARTAADEAVYAVALTSYELPNQARDWLDNGLLKVDLDGLKSIEVTSAGQAGIKLIGQGESTEDDKAQRSWKAEGLGAGEQVNAEQARALVRAINELRVDGVLGTEAKAEWRQDQPLLTLGLEKGDGETVIWTLSKPEKGDMHVLKASDRPWYLELEEWNAKPLLEATARDKLIVVAKPAESPKPEGDAPAAGSESAPEPTDPGASSASPQMPSSSNGPQVDQ